MMCPIASRQIAIWIVLSVKRNGKKICCKCGIHGDYLTLTGYPHSINNTLVKSSPSYISLHYIYDINSHIHKASPLVFVSLFHSSLLINNNRNKSKAMKYNTENGREHV